MKPSFETLIMGERDNHNPLWMNSSQSKSLSWLHALGNQSQVQLKEEMIFPIPRGTHNQLSERWKYTSLKGLQSPSLELSKTHPTNWQELVPAKWKSISQSQPCLVIINGHFCGILGHVPKELGITRFEDISPKETQQRILSLLQISTKEITHLNNATFQSGIYISLEKGIHIETPLWILNLVQPNSTSEVSSNRVIIDLKDEARLIIVQSFEYISEKAENESQNWELLTTDAHISRSASLTYYKLHSGENHLGHISELNARVESHGELHTFALTNGGKLARQENHISLLGSESYASQWGLSLGFGKRHVDHHTSVTHAAAHARSDQYYKGIFTDQSRGIFQGSIFVSKGSIKTVAKQLNKNLLLSNEAEVDTKPQLEIDNDDVKCSHGATVGQLRPDELFYLVSRGIPPRKAKALLCQAFVEEVLFAVSHNSVREILGAWLHQNLEQLVESSQFTS